MIASVAKIRSSVLLAQETAPLLEKLDPTRRVAVVMALLGLALLGLLLVACIMIGARWVRRISGSRPGVMRPAIGDRISIQKKSASHLPSVDSGETMIVDPGTDETIIDE